MFKKLFSFLFLLFIVCQLSFSQVMVTIRVIDNSGNPVTGLTDANIKFKLYDYTGGYVTGLTVTEVGVQGNYQVSGFAFQTLQLTKLYINGTEQTWFGQQFTGSPYNVFPPFAGTSTISGVWAFTGANTHTGAENHTGAEHHTGVETHTGAETHTGVETHANVERFNAGIDCNNFPIQHVATPTISTDAVNKAYVDALVSGNAFPINANRILVDSKQASDVAGKIYNTIAEAVTYAHTSGSPSTSNRWTILIMPNQNNKYVENFTWYDFIDFVGIGNVTVSNTPNTPPYSIFIRSVVNSNRNVRVANINFEQTDANIDFLNMIMVNCSITTIEDNDPPDLYLSNSQLENFKINFANDATGNIILVSTNNFLNVVSNKLLTFGSGDQVVNYTVNTGFNFQQP